MAVLTIEIPDKAAKAITQAIEKQGGSILARSDEGISKEEQLSLNQGLKEAMMIKARTLKPLRFEDLWDE